MNCDKVTFIDIGNLNHDEETDFYRNILDKYEKGYQRVTIFTPFKFKYNYLLSFFNDYKYVNVASFDREVKLNYRIIISLNRYNDLDDINELEEYTRLISFLIKKGIDVLIIANALEIKHMEYYYDLMYELYRNDSFISYEKEIIEVSNTNYVKEQYKKEKLNDYNFVWREIVKRLHPDKIKCEVSKKIAEKYLKIINEIREDKHLHDWGKLKMSKIVYSKYKNEYKNIN
jgi:hypothetical protein